MSFLSQGVSVTLSDYGECPSYVKPDGFRSGLPPQASGYY